MKHLLLLALGISSCATSFAADAARILIVVGPTNHPPGTHEVAAGGRLMKYCLENMANVPGVKVDLVNEWPKDGAVRAAASTVVFIGDTFPPNRLPNAAQNLAELGEMMERGCGIVCVHYATGLLGEDVKPDGDHPLLRWMGGYFANRSCPHHESIAKIYPEATIQPAVPQHPVWRGCREFTLNDEPYINNYFGKEGHKLAANVTALATSMLPPDAPKQETVSWCVERPDTGRGFAIVMPHFYRNWKVEDLRRYILNGIVWTAKLDVPEAGVQTTLADLSIFAPVSIEPVPRKVKAASAPALTPIFHDDFERAEIGERWKVSLNAFRIVDGVLRAQQMRAEHGAVGAVETPMSDGVVEFKFRFEGAASVNAVWDDKGFTGSHAGHLCRVAITPRQIRLGDDREGAMRPDILEMRKDPARKAEVEKLLVGRGAAFPAKIEQGRWYRLRAEIAGDELRVSLDGQPVGMLKSPGIAHPTKTHFHFTVSGKDALFDDVRVWAVEPPRGQ